VDKARRDEHDQQRVARQLLPRRNRRELAHDDFEIALDRSKVGASLVGFAASLALRAKLGRLGGGLALKHLAVPDVTRADDANRAEQILGNIIALKRGG
jgi:hypothetical protein